MMITSGRNAETASRPDSFFPASLNSCQQRPPEAMFINILYCYTGILPPRLRILHFLDRPPCQISDRWWLSRQVSPRELSPVVSKTHWSCNHQTWIMILSRTVVTLYSFVNSKLHEILFSTKSLINSHLLCTEYCSGRWSKGSLCDRKSSLCRPEPARGCV